MALLAAFSFDPNQSVPQVIIVRPRGSRAMRLLYILSLRKVLVIPRPFDKVIHVDFSEMSGGSASTSVRVLLRVGWT